MRNGSKFTVIGRSDLIRLISNLSKTLFGNEQRERKRRNKDMNRKIGVPKAVWQGGEAKTRWWHIWTGGVIGIGFRDTHRWSEVLWEGASVEIGLNGSLPEGRQKKKKRRDWGSLFCSYLYSWWRQRWRWRWLVESEITFWFEQVSSFAQKRVWCLWLWLSFVYLIFKKKWHLGINVWNIIYLVTTRQFPIFVKLPSSSRWQ